MRIFLNWTLFPEASLTSLLLKFLHIWAYCTAKPGSSTACQGEKSMDYLIEIKYRIRNQIFFMPLKYEIMQTFSIGKGSPCRRPNRCIFWASLPNQSWSGWTWQWAYQISVGWACSRWQASACSPQPGDLPPPCLKKNTEKTLNVLNVIHVYKRKASFHNQRRSIFISDQLHNVI